MPAVRAYHQESTRLPIQDIKDIPYNGQIVIVRLKNEDILIVSDELNKKG